MYDKNIQEVAPAATYSHPPAAVQHSALTASLSGMGAFLASSQGPPWVGRRVPRQQGAWQAHPCPHFQQQGCPEAPLPPSRGHHPHCRTLGSAQCQRGTKHPPSPSSSSSTSGALWEAGRSGNNKFMAKASQEAPSSCESVTQSRSHTETPKLQEHCIPGILSAAQPPLWSKQHPRGQAPTGTAPAPLGTPWHRGSSATPLLQ